LDPADRGDLLIEREGMIGAEKPGDHPSGEKRADKKREQQISTNLCGGPFRRRSPERSGFRAFSEEQPYQ